jgi:hypothetical protein
LIVHAGNDTGLESDFGGFHCGLTHVDTPDVELVNRGFQAVARCQERAALSARPAAG